MQSGTSLNLWTRGSRNALEIAKVMGYKETDEKTIYEKLCKENARHLVSGMFKIKDVSKQFLLPFIQNLLILV